MNAELERIKEQTALDKVRRAIAVADDRRKLEKRLRAAKHCLAAELRPRFAVARFDFAGKRLIGDGYALQWRLRPNPAEPESYTNQQTNSGMVELVEL